ncbi:MAG: 3-carboxy-cis,cis-muconate cycloisomerase [Ruegeria sp.]|nr:3-carboxy-cis,cis-muconate cycloisomerase [Ruegeria sp.]
MTDVFSHPWLGGHFSDPETETMLSADAMLGNMLAVEVAYTRALGEVGVVDKLIADETVAHITQVSANIEDLRQGTAKDGLVVPALVRSLRADLPERCHKALHSGLTSQDVIDTATVMSLKPVCELFSKRLEALIKALGNLKKSHGRNGLMGRTRMQAALPITVADRIDIWMRPLADHQYRLHQQQDRLLSLQFGGAVGTRNAVGPHAPEIAAQMARELGLNNPDTCWHTDRSRFADFANWLSLMTGSLGKMGQDIALMAQQGVDEIRLNGGGGSSAMPHKQNPVQAELLITLARFNATLVSGMHHALIHEQERSGAAWSLEWMILPQAILTTGRALTVSDTLLEQIEAMGKDAGDI